MLHSIQAARAVAAIAVLLYHLSLMMGEARYGGEAVFVSQTKHMNKGIDFFFVLSGFIIAYAHAKDIGRPARFWRYARNRFTRLYPIYWLYTVIFAALLYVGLGPNTPTPPIDAVYWLQTLSLLRFEASTPPLPAAWTLFHEIAFYLLFGVVILRMRLGFALMVVWWTACLVVFQVPGEGEHTPLRVYLALHNLHFLTGLAAYYLYRHLDSHHARMMLLSGIAGISVCVAALYADADEPLTRWILGWFFGLAIAALAQLETQKSYETPRTLCLLGAASYTIYLTHGKLLSVGLKLTAALPPHDARLTYVAVAAGAIACCTAIYLLVERPILAALRPKASPPQYARLRAA